MYENYKELGLYTCEAVENLQDKEHIELVECIEGCLLDNVLLYDNKSDIYYMCTEHAQNEWSSCYKVSCGNGKIIYEKWNRLTEEIEVA